MVLLLYIFLALLLIIAIVLNTKLLSNMLLGDYTQPVCKKHELLLDYNNNFRPEIPKIIHQTAPKDQTKWHPIWFKCQTSWKTYFKDFTYMMWTDEDLDNLIKTDFSWFYDIYKSYDRNISRIDIARYFILYKYGGIYADMDYECFENFYDRLNQAKVSISESPYTRNEYLQNALMISPKKHPFWKLVIAEAENRFNSKKGASSHSDVLYNTGPVLISDVYFSNFDYVIPLDYKLWNPLEKDKLPGMIAVQYGTAVWASINLNKMPSIFTPVLNKLVNNKEYTKCKETFKQTHVF